LDRLGDHSFWRDESVMTFVGYALLIVGGFVCLMNFYLSYVRCLIFWLRGGRREEYEHISGCVVVGSLAVAASLFWLHDVSWILAVAIVLILLDTGGIHWFAATMLYVWLFVEEE